MALIRTLMVTNKTIFNSHFKVFGSSRIIYNKYSSKSIEPKDTGPIKFTQSPASKWTAKISRTGIQNPRLDYEPFIILSSLAIFLLYFCVFREENDIDRELEKSLYKTIHGLEEQQLYAILEYNREKGLDTKDIINRLKEIKLEKSN